MTKTKDKVNVAEATSPKVETNQAPKANDASKILIFPKAVNVEYDSSDELLESSACY